MNDLQEQILKLQLENANYKAKIKFLNDYKRSYEDLQKRFIMATSYISDMHLNNADIMFIYDILNGEDCYYAENFTR